MNEQTLEVAPGPGPRSVRTQSGDTLEAPRDWALLPPGDAALTRRVKESGPSWTVVERKGRKRFSRGVWAPAANIERIRAALEEERKDPRYARKLEQGRQQRAREQAAYVLDFQAEVVRFLAFHPRYDELAERLARAISQHATPVGSGTVARTERIAIDRRAEAATIAWMRHQTTAYDHMKIARVRGMRRDVRRMLAEQSRSLLERYRRGESVSGPSCPLQRALLAAAGADAAGAAASLPGPG